MRLVVTGRVQGVGYRYFVVRQAERLGVVGWVRNREDGAVELEAEGEAAALGRLVEALWEGPALARVEGVERTERTARGEERRFSVVV